MTRRATAEETKFTGTEIPSPPAKVTPWTSPEASPKWIRDTKQLFELGMADPRGCEYRKIKVVTGDTWSVEPNVIQVHGWVIPGKTTQSFAVCWNGLVYPVLEVGEPCSLQEDVGKLIEKTSGDKKKVHWDTQFMSEKKAIAYDTLTCLKIPLILRVGDAELVHRITEAWEKSDFSNYHPASGKPEDALIWPEAWMFQLFNRAIGAIQRRDDMLAILSL